jgi:hypothetical protein
LKKTKSKKSTNGGNLPYRFLPYLSAVVLMRTVDDDPEKCLREWKCPAIWLQMVSEVYLRYVRKCDIGIPQVPAVIGQKMPASMA